MTKVAPTIVAVATMMRSAGSLRMGFGKETDLMAIALSIGMNLTNGNLSDLAIQSLTSIVSCKRPLATSRATSQALMDEIKISSFSTVLSIIFLAGRERFSGLLTHQSQV